MDTKLYVQNMAQKIIFCCEMQGQISDGYWENSKPWEHWHFWNTITWANVIVSTPEKLGVYKPKYKLISKRNYAFYNKELLDIVDKHKLYGCVDELSFFIYVNCSLDEYIDKYHPVMVQGVAQDMTINDLLISKVQREFNDYIDTKLKMDIYMKHM